MEHEANLLWINSDSSYNFHEAWLRENFRKNERGQVITVKSDNVLEPAVINKVNTVGLTGIIMVVMVVMVVMVMVVMMVVMEML